MSAEKRKKRQRRRQQTDWEAEGDKAFSHDRKRHKRTTLAVKTHTPKTPAPEDFEPNGTVVSHTKKYAFVLVDGEELECRIDEWIIEDRSTLLAPGDRVLVEYVEDIPFVRAIAPRRSKLGRPRIEGSRVAEQIVAANVDLLVIVTTAKKPRFKSGLIDRYLLLAEAGNVKPLICLNKWDLVDEEPEGLAVYRDLDIPVVRTSATEATGVDALRDALQGSLSVLAGQSGVGKSSLLNALQPDLDIDTSAVSTATEKGRHTTTASRLYQLDDETRIIDTPGIRRLDVSTITEAELPYYFPEFDAPAQECRFRNCTHTHEPDCGVRAAVESGTIAPRRYGSYCRIRESLAE